MTTRRVCCIVCKRELSTQGLPGHFRAVHDRPMPYRWGVDWGKEPSRSVTFNRRAAAWELLRKALRERRIAFP